jgi:hypothetical protein
MGLHLERGHYVLHCDACPAEMDTETPVLIDAGAIAATAEWNCAGNEWYCRECSFTKWGVKSDAQIRPNHLE